MAAIEADAPRLTLASFGGPDAPPDNYVQPPSKGGSAPAQETKSEPAKGAATDEPKISPIVTDDEPEKTEPDPDKPAKGADDDDPKKTLGDTLEDPAEVARKEAAEKRAKEKEDADKAAATAAQTDEEKSKTAAEQRDSDLKYEAGAHTHPKTRTVITKFQAAAKLARDERDAAAAKAAELEKRAIAAEEKAKTAPAPKELEDEVKSLRETVRRLDITQDPVIQQKYDAKIAANNESIISVLKNNGLGTSVDKDGNRTEHPNVIKEFVAGGVNEETVYPLIIRLRESAAELKAAGQTRNAMAALKDADKLYDYLRRNDGLQQDKMAEIESWKGSESKRKQEIESVTKQQRDAQGQAFRHHTDTILKAETDALAKEFPYINQPPAPLPTDVPATVKAKEAAIAEWTAAAKNIETAVKGFSTDGVTPEKLAEVVGRINAAAIQSQQIKYGILPRVKAELSAKTARIAELEKELNGIREAGKLSRQHSSASNEPGFNGRPEPKSLEEALQDPARM